MTVIITIACEPKEIPFIEEHIKMYESGVESYLVNEDSVYIVFKWRSHARRFMDHIAPEVPYTPPAPQATPVKKNWAQLIMDWLRG